MNPFTMADLRARARADLRLGLPVRLRAPTGFESLVLAASVVEDRWLAAVRQVAADGPMLAVSRHRAETLRARAYDGDIARFPLDDEMDASLVRAIADPIHDLAAPLKGPFISMRNGDAEGARQAVQMVRGAGLLPAAAVARMKLPLPDWVHVCVACDVDESAAPQVVSLEVKANLPVHGAPDSKAHVFRELDSGEEHLALVVGNPEPEKPPLTRVHSSCLTGDLLGSLRCDCGGQLSAALRLMADNGAGVLVVLQQEGRGIGLANKMRAYRLQDLGYDTYEANRRMGFAEDHRDFKIAAEVLRSLGYGSIRLLTSNPDKASALEGAGIEIVERIPLRVEGSPHNAAYLQAKAKRHGAA